MLYCKNIKDSIHLAIGLWKILCNSLLFLQQTDLHICFCLGSYSNGFFILWVKRTILEYTKQQNRMRPVGMGSVQQSIHKGENPPMSNSELAIYCFTVKLKKILWRLSKCVLSSTQSVHYVNVKNKYDGERDTLSRCLNHCIMFFYNYEKRFAFTLDTYFIWLVDSLWRARRISPSRVWSSAEREVPAINLKLWQQWCPMPHLTIGLQFLTL